MLIINNCYVFHSLQNFEFYKTCKNCKMHHLIDLKLHIIQYRKITKAFHCKCELGFSVGTGSIKSNKQRLFSVYEVVRVA